MKGRLWGRESLFMVVQFGNLEWTHVPGTLRYGWKGLWNWGVSLCGSSVKGTWREGSLAEDPKGYIEKVLETGIFFTGASSGKPGGGLFYRGLWELDKGALGLGHLSLSQEAPWRGLRESFFTGEPERCVFWEICKIPCKRASTCIGTLLGKLEGICLPGLWREINGTPGFLSWTRRSLRFYVCVRP